MNKKQWKHKITGGLTGVILSLIMLVGFGGLTIWMHTSGNDAIIIGRIVVIFAALAFILALYRAVFFKVLIGKDGFFYQTDPRNGRYYNYCEIQKAWTSSGRETNAREMNYCNFEADEGKIVRFSFTGADTKAVEYFLKRVELVEVVDNNRLVDDKHEYHISGRVQGLQRVAVIIFILGILLVLANSLAEQGLQPLTYMVSIVVALLAIVLVIIHYLFYKISIKNNGFYCRTNPFDGKYYKYSEIVDCQLIEKRKKFGSVRARGTRETHYFYFLLFVDISGKEQRILYDKALFEHEMNVLVSRIKQAQNKDDGDEKK